jgi:hypothetical protein
VQRDVADQTIAMLHCEGEEVVGLQQHRVLGAVLQVPTRLIGVPEGPVKEAHNLRVALDRVPVGRVFHAVRTEPEPLRRDHGSNRGLLESSAAESRLADAESDAQVAESLTQRNGRGAVAGKGCWSYGGHTAGD